MLLYSEEEEVYAERLELAEGRISELLEELCEKLGKGKIYRIGERRFCAISAASFLFVMSV